MPRPIALSDAQLTMILQAARPLPVEDRDRFLQAIADVLRDQRVLGDGTVHRAIAEVQRRFFDPPSSRETAYIAHVAERTKAMQPPATKAGVAPRTRAMLQRK